MERPPHTRVVYVDVDDTLVRSVGTKRIPIPAAVAEVRRLHARGDTLILWSAGGAEVARATAAELRLEGLFAAYLPKPNVLFDDQPVAAWTTCRHVRPDASVDP